MAEQSNIAWTGNTFNGWIGCTRVSPACDRCYAAEWAKRYERDVTWGEPGQKAKLRLTSDANWRKPHKWNRDAEKSGTRTKVFCSSLSDVFDNDADPMWRKRLWDVIAATPHLDWQLLTKRPQNIQKMLPDDWGVKGYANVWLGTTAENQTEYDRRKPILMSIPARIRFISMEPLLGPIAMGDGNAAMPDWVIVGGESGAGFRPMSMEAVESIRAQCANRGIAFFFKQDSSMKPGCKGRASDSLWSAKYFPVK